MKKTHELEQAYVRAREIFRQQSDTEFIPHLSLIYGRLLLRTKKEIRSNLRTDLGSISFDIRSVQLVETERHNPEDWIVIKEFVLKG